MPSSWVDLPEESLSVGSWALLLELKREFSEHYGGGELADLRPLIESSIVRWRAVYDDERFLGELPEGRPLKEFSRVVSYLEECLVKRDDGPLWLERLLVPYIMSIETDVDGQRHIRWWLPPKAFIETTNFRNRLYPFLTPALFDHLRNSPGGARQPAPKPASTFDDWLTLFASGMGAIQSKLIGSFEKADTPSRFEDRLVGNASGYIHVLSAQSREPVGMFILCSPVFGLFHRLLLPANKDRTRLHIEGNFVCGSNIDLTTRHELEVGVRRGGDKIVAHDCGDTEAVATYFVTSRSERAKEKPLSLVLCTASNEQTCPFALNEEWLGPTAAEFLAGIQKLASRTALEQAEEVIATQEHTTQAPLTNAAVHLEWASLLMEAGNLEKAGRRTKLARKIIQDLLETLSSLERLRLGRAGASGPVSLAEIVNEHVRYLQHTGCEVEFTPHELEETSDTRVNADRGLCAAIVTNLLINAMQTAHQNTTQQPIHTRLERDGSTVCLVVTNLAERATPKFIHEVMENARSGLRNASQKTAGVGVGVRDSVLLARRMSGEFKLVLQSGGLLEARLLLPAYQGGAADA